MYGSLPDTVEQITGGGGRHIFFASNNEQLSSKAKAFGQGFPGLDIRAAGGYVIVPPSTHSSGAQYEWEASSHPEEIPLAPAPQWLLDRLKSTPGTTSEDSGSDELIYEGSRNDRLFRVASSIRNQGFGSGTILTAIKAVNSSECRPPLDKTELQQIASSASRYVPSNGRNGLSSLNSLNSPWPDALEEAAYLGPVGEYVMAIAPHTEADPAAVLVQMLIGFGNLIGRPPHFLAEADTHRMNENIVLVGDTAKARKGVSYGHAMKLLKLCDPGWAANIKSGLSTGEGLIHNVRDERWVKKSVKKKGGGWDIEEVLEDEGIDDKRLLIYEPEFGRTLQVMARESNTLSAILRQAWDSGDLHVLTRNQVNKATGAHISVIGHITIEELRKLLTGTDLVNGFANRFLWVCVKRSQFLPFGGELDQVDLSELQARLGTMTQWVREHGKRIHFDDTARPLWQESYEGLSTGAYGTYGSVTARSEAHVMRLAALYALSTQSQDISHLHLEAALALYRYMQSSARYIFGDTPADSTAARILRMLRDHPGGFTRTKIHKLFAGHLSRNSLQLALDNLAASGQAFCEHLPTAGRPTEQWSAVTTAAKQAN